MHLERVCDGVSVFSRDCLVKGVDDYRPMVGVIAQVKSRGWILEVVPSGKDGKV